MRNYESLVFLINYLGASSFSLLILVWYANGSLFRAISHKSKPWATESPTAGVPAGLSSSKTCKRLSKVILVSMKDWDSLSYGHTRLRWTGFTNLLPSLSVYALHPDPRNFLLWLTHYPEKTWQELQQRVQLYAFTSHV